MTSDAATEGEPTPEERRALFRVVWGTPTDAELAALVAVLAGATHASSARPPEAPKKPCSTWNNPVARLRRPLPTGPDAWRTSTWPR